MYNKIYIQINLRPNYMYHIHVTRYDNFFFSLYTLTKIYRHSMKTLLNLKNKYNYIDCAFSFNKIYCITY